MRNCRFLALVLFCLILGAARANASALNACYGDWGPYIFRDSSGQLTGIAFDMLSTAAKELDREIQYVSLPYKRCVAEVKAGRLDIALFMSPGSDANLAESRTVFAYWTLAAIVRQDDPIQAFVSLDQFARRKVLVVDGYQYPGRLRRWLAEHEQLQRVSYGAEQENGYLAPFHMIEAGRADVFIEDLYWSRQFIHQRGLSLRALEPAIAHEADTIGFRPGLSDLRDDIDRVLERRGAAFRNALFRKYTGQPEAVFVGTPNLETPVDDQ